MSVTLKVALVGPRKSGKTRIANQLAGIPVHDDDDYKPTAGARILEFDMPIKAKREEVVPKIELWDISGDQKYESCWTAVMHELDGAVVVFDPTSKNQANEVHLWCEWFCKHANLGSNQAIIFAYGNLSSDHKPLRVKAGNRKVIVPINNVSFKQIKPDQTLSCHHQFKKILSKLYVHHLENLEKNMA